ncbi:MAG: TolC family protein [Methylotenera sp.]|nr:TolC family protein [Oligoflexia bacterium]
MTWFLLVVTILSQSAKAFAGAGAAADASVVPGLSFDQAIERILSRSTGIATQQANLKATQARNLPARLAFLPTVTLDARRVTTDRARLYTLPGYQVEAVAGLNLFRFGADVSGWKAATADEETQQSLLKNEILKTEDQALQAIVGFVRTQLELAVYSHFVELQQQIVKIARARYDRGLLPLQEVDRVAIDLDNATARLADSQTRAVVARSQLVNLLGDEAVRAEWDWKRRLLAVKTIDTDPAKLLESRPDLQAAGFRVRGEDQRYTRDVQTVLPTLDADVRYGKYGSTGFGEGDSPQWTAGIGVTFPVFDHLERYSRARAQSFTRAAAEQTLEQTRRDALAEWTSAKQSFGVAVQSAVSRDRTLKLSENIYSENLKRFQSARINANDLAIDQSRFYDAEILNVQGWSAAHLEFSRYCHAMGKRVEECHGN